MQSKIQKKQATKKTAPIKNSIKVKDYGNDPFFVEKADKSKIFLEKHGFPEKLLRKK